jgi:hypothetical protein
MTMTRCNDAVNEDTVERRGEAAPSCAPRTQGEAWASGMVLIRDLAGLVHVAKEDDLASFCALHAPGAVVTDLPPMRDLCVRCFFGILFQMVVPTP